MNDNINKELLYFSPIPIPDENCYVVKNEATIDAGYPISLSPKSKIAYVTESNLETFCQEFGCCHKDCDKFNWNLISKQFQGVIIELKDCFIGGIWNLDCILYNSI